MDINLIPFENPFAEDFIDNFFLVGGVLYCAKTIICTVWFHYRTRITKVGKMYLNVVLLFTRNNFVRIIFYLNCPFLLLIGDPVAIIFFFFIVFNTLLIIEVNFKLFVTEVSNLNGPNFQA